MADTIPKLSELLLFGFRHPNSKGFCLNGIHLLSFYRYPRSEDVVPFFAWHTFVFNVPSEYTMYPDFVKTLSGYFVQNKFLLNCN